MGSLRHAGLIAEEPAASVLQQFRRIGHPCTVVAALERLDALLLSH
jgi:hypothetical protein